MMKFLLTISMLFSFAFGQKAILGVARTAGCVGVSGISFCNKTVVFMGNSITLGELPVDLGPLKWTSRFCAAKRSTEDNRGVNGQTMDQPCVDVFAPSSIPVYNSTIHAALFISLGENDIGINANTGTYTPATFKTAYTAAVVYAIDTRGWPAGLIIIVNAYQPYSWTTYSDATLCGTLTPADGTRAGLYNAKIAEVASENGCIYIDIYTAMNGLDATYFNVDGLHPNALGDGVIANYLINNL